MEIDTTTQNDHEQKFQAQLKNFLEEKLRVGDEASDQVVKVFMDAHHRAVQKGNLDDLNDVTRDYLLQK